MPEMLEHGSRPWVLDASPEIIIELLEARIAAAAVRRARSHLRASALASAGSTSATAGGVLAFAIGGSTVGWTVTVGVAAIAVMLSFQAAVRSFARSALVASAVIALVASVS